MLAVIHAMCGRHARRLAAATAVAALLAVPGRPATPRAAGTVTHAGVDGFDFGTCFDTLGTNWAGESVLYIGTVNTKVLNGCHIDLEVWADNIGKIDSLRVDRTSARRHGAPLPGTCLKPRVHADAYLHAANGGFRVGPSASVTLQKDPTSC